MDMEFAGRVKVHLQKAEGLPARDVTPFPAVPLPPNSSSCSYT